MAENRPNTGQGCVLEGFDQFIGYTKFIGFSHSNEFMTVGNILFIIVRCGFLLVVRSMA